MTQIHLKTSIKGQIQEVFDLSRSIDFHIKSAYKTKEEAIAGTTTGLIGLNQEVRWRGKHLGLWLTHTSKIIAFESPRLFTDIMIAGNFTYFIHTHEFTQNDGEVIMTDRLRYKLPYGKLGSLVDRLVVKRHLKQFLEQRNRAIKLAIEGENQQAYVQPIIQNSENQSHLFI